MSTTKRNVLVTGASTGIGRATALHFHGKGWNVAASMRTPEKAGWAAGDSLAAIRLDVTDVGSIRSGIQAARDRFGALDVVVNNAGYGLVGPFEASTPEQVARQFDTNVFGIMHVCREVLPLFRERGTGVIVNVASMGGRITFPLYSCYHATKWAVEGFTEALGYELGPLGIRVKIVEPGPIKTDFYDRSMDLMKKDGLTAYDAFIARTMPKMNEAGAKGATPERVAATIFRAATDGSVRLRYPVNAAPILLLRRLLPDRLFQGIIRTAVGA
ncbi:MAG: SDR family oxidoreductase [Acidobacteriota bacterium]